MASWRTDIRSLTRGLLDRGDAPVFGLEDHPLLRPRARMAVPIHRRSAALMARSVSLNGMTFRAEFACLENM
jgi:hypothetical protein